MPSVLKIYQLQKHLRSSIFLSSASIPKISIDFQFPKSRLAAQQALFLLQVLVAPVAASMTTKTTSRSTSKMKAHARVSISTIMKTRSRLTTLRFCCTAHVRLMLNHSISKVNRSGRKRHLRSRETFVWNFCLKMMLGKDVRTK